MELQYGCIQSKSASAIGPRQNMEDTFVQRATEQGWLLLGVFDGHGGRDVAEKLKKDFPLFFETALLQHEGPLDTQVNMLTFITKIFAEFDRSLRLPHLSVGSTATMVLIEPTQQMAWLINLGDSRTVVFDTKGNVLLSTKDHKPGDPLEKLRIEQAGGFVTFRGLPRVNGVLSVSRAFGDFSLKEKGSLRSPISVQPDVYPMPLTKGLSFVLASDGFWDVTTPEDIWEDEQIIPIDRLLTNALRHPLQLDNVTLLQVQVL